MEKKKCKKALKIVLIILFIIIVLFLILTLRKFFIIKGLQNNFKQYVSSQNYHIKSVAKESNDTVVTINYYKKDNKYVTILEREYNGEVQRISTYNNGERIDMFWDSSEGKKAQLGVDSEIMINLYNGLENENDFQTFLASIYARISQTEYNGKKCYVINDFFSTMSLSSENKNESYIEKDTGLMIKYDSGYVVTDKEYEFNNVDDRIFEEPDIGQYKLIENH